VSTAGYEHFEVEADVGVRGWGPSRVAAFEQVAIGVFALIVAPDEVEARDQRHVLAQGETPEALLVNWINECLYVHEIEGFVVSRVELLVLESDRLHAALHGEQLDPARHRAGTVVKAATLHGIRVTASNDGHEARLIVDV
jgi:SHS2 domain-containing protein